MMLSFYYSFVTCLGRDKGGYFHEHFLRGKEDLAVKVLRTKFKGTGPRRPNSMESPVPNFYEMNFLPDSRFAKTSQTVKDTHMCTPVVPSMKTFEASIPEGTASLSPVRTDDDKSVPSTSIQERLHQIELLNGIDRDILLLSRASYNIQKYVQAQKSCQTNYHGMALSSPSSIVSCNNPMQASFVGLNYPSAFSSRFVPLSSSSYNPSDMISAALTRYYQQQRLNN